MKLENFEIANTFFPYVIFQVSIHLRRYHRLFRNKKYLFANLFPLPNRWFASSLLSRCMPHMHQILYHFATNLHCKSLQWDYSGITNFCL